MTATDAPDRTAATLASDGGDPVRRAPFPGVGNAAGRTLGDEEIDALTRVIRSGQLNSTVGGETRLLEQEFAAYFGAGYAVASSSGTAALHLAVAAVDPEPGEEIITTPISDAGTILPILAQNAVPVFADVDPWTGNIDVESVRAAITPRTRAIIAVHLFGSPAPVHELRQIADEHELVLIEDCAQAYLTRTEPDDRLAGRVGQIGCFSLQQSKHITAGDGGLCLTDDVDLDQRMRLFADKGWPRVGETRTHLFLGLNYRMTELQAAVARAQLPKLAGVVDRRRVAADALSDVVGGLAGLRPADHRGMSYWLYPIVIDPAIAGGDNRRYAEALVAEGIPARAGYLARPLYMTPMLTERRTYGRSAFPLTAPPARVDMQYGAGMCPAAERMISTTLITIGWNENYTPADVADIAAAIAKVHGWFSSGSVDRVPTAAERRSRT